MMTNLNQQEILRYSRHLMIPNVGLAGQEKLKNASVLIVGLGGLGSPISLYLAAAGIGRLGLVDFDVVEESNLQRQVVHGTSRLGVPKVESARDRLLDVNPYINVEIYKDYFSAENANQIADGYDILVDGCDNFNTRYLINDYCVLNNKPYVYGSIFQFEGQVSVFDAKNGPCYRCIFPTPPPPGLIPTCGEGGVFGVLPGTIGTIQATEVIKLVLGIGESAKGKLYLYDALDLSLQDIQLKKNPSCPICGNNPEITSLTDTEIFCATHSALEDPIPETWEMDAFELDSALKNNEKIQIIDVRNPVELEIVEIPGAINIPFERISGNFNNPGNDNRIVFVCRNGIRSSRVVRKLRKEGQSNVFNLRDGTNGWVRNIETKKLRY
jgi:adenylyltransferase/sulfurtransferase